MRAWELSGSRVVARYQLSRSGRKSPDGLCGRVGPLWVQARAPRVTESTEGGNAERAGLSQRKMPSHPTIRARPFKQTLQNKGFFVFGSVRSVPPQLQIGRKTAGGTPRPSGFFTIESPLAPEPQRNILSSQNSGWKIAFDKLDNRVGQCCGLGGCL